MHQCFPHLFAIKIACKCSRLAPQQIIPRAPAQPNALAVALGPHKRRLTVTPLATSSPFVPGSGHTIGVGRAADHSCSDIQSARILLHCSVNARRAPRVLLAVHPAKVMWCRGCERSRGRWRGAGSAAIGAGHAKRVSVVLVAHKQCRKVTPLAFI